MGRPGEARYLDDMREGHELVIYLDDQGDVYVSVLPEGHKIGPSVRLCASGGAASLAPGLLPAMRAAHRAILNPDERPTLTRAQGINVCMRVAWPILFTGSWTERGEWAEATAIEAVESALAGDSLLTFAVATRDRLIAAVLAEARRLVDSGECPDLANEPALKEVPDAR